MVESLFTWKRIKAKHLQAPLLKERERYLTHLLNEGVSIDRVRSVATLLLHVIRLMEFDQLRPVEPSEIRRGEELWTRDTSESHKTRKIGPSSGESFHYAALKWLHFLKVIRVPEPTVRPAELVVTDFDIFMKEHQGMSPASRRVYGSRVKRFLEWILSRGQAVSSISLSDVDEYLKMEQRRGCLPRTIASHCVALRLFFRYAEVRGWTGFRIARGIKNPRVPRYDPCSKSPAWKQVRQLLDANISGSTADLRASAILFLCAIYGLRSSEIVSLTLNDFDWINETFTVRRSKRGRIQQYPIQYEVGEAILQYLRFGRPRALCRNLFLTLKPPFRPVRSSSLWILIDKRIQRVGMQFSTHGPHSFRHACATELLRRGSSLSEIADFLGHLDLESVSIYAKHDFQSLRRVADFRLGSVV
jgi:site-specific recombinase XerD